MKTAKSNSISLIGKFFKREFVRSRAKEEADSEAWEKNLFSDLGRLKGRLIVMKMG